MYMDHRHPRLLLYAIEPPATPPTYGLITSKMLFTPIRDPFSCKKNISEIAAGPMDNPTLPPTFMSMRQAKHCAYVWDRATPIALTKVIKLPIRSTGRRPIRWLIGIQKNEVIAFKMEGTDPMYVAVVSGTLNSAASSNASGAYGIY